MSIDYDVEVVYGFALDSRKLKSFEKGRQAVDPDFDIFHWFDEVAERGNCEFIVDNAWHDYDVNLCKVYFGIRYENRLNISLMAELDADRREEVTSEFINAFGGDLQTASVVLDENQDFIPDFFAFVSMY